MKLSDYLINYLADYGVCHIFMVTGGGAMHLNDSIGKESRIQYICNHHEQACAMAAEGYARVSGKVGVICVTTGPGGINALNGVFGAWTDSIPMLVISGQVKRETCMAFNNVPGLRQLGDQEADIISMVKGITKYAVLVREPESIRYHLEKALYLATSGRPGPCWLDIPLDVQASKLDIGGLAKFDPALELSDKEATPLNQHCKRIIARLSESNRPVIMLGTGVRTGRSLDTLAIIINKLAIPVTTAWGAHDILPNNNPFYAGRPGALGDRSGNFAVQNADLLIVLGCRLNIRQISYNWRSFARAAFKIQVDVDRAELCKPTVIIDHPVHADVGDFLIELDRQLGDSSYNAEKYSEWVTWCRQRLVRYPVAAEHKDRKTDKIDAYEMIKRLFSNFDHHEIVVCGNGSACVIPFQIALITDNLRMFANSGCASMGYDLPAALGAAIATEGKRVICMAGDGSIMMNIQELQTVRHYNLPIKIFIINNNGYSSIRQTQRNFFGRMVGEGPYSGVSLPDFVAVGASFGITSFKADYHNMEEIFKKVLETDGPTLCEIMVDPDQQFSPRLTSRTLDDGTIVSSPLEDMYPFLNREELSHNMLITPYSESKSR